MDERRRAPRTALGVPLKVRGHVADGTSWEETATTLDTSAGGVAFPSTQPLKKGQIVHLELPLPRSFREFDLSEPIYRVYALVRDSAEAPPIGYRVGVMFFGKMPPRGYEKNPAAQFLLPWDGPSDEGTTPPPAPPRPQPLPALGVAPAPAPAATDPSDRRRFQRHQIFLNLTLQQEDEWGMVLQEELTVTENIGKGGARVMTSLGFAKGDVLMVQEMGGTFATRAEVRDVTAANGHVRRLFLKFLDQQPPDRLLQAR